VKFTNSEAATYGEISSLPDRLFSNKKCKIVSKPFRTTYLGRVVSSALKAIILARR